jgi:hypothetical protein
VHASDWTASSVAVAALLVSVASFVYSRRATTASELQAAVAGRDEQRRLAEADRTAVAWAPEFTWGMGSGPLEHEHIATIRFTNSGTAVARNVRILLPPGSQIIDGFDNIPAVEPGLPISVAVIVKVLLSRDAHFGIKWRVQESGPSYFRRYTWRSQPPEPSVY